MNDMEAHPNHIQEMHERRRMFATSLEEALQLCQRDCMQQALRMAFTRGCKPKCESEADDPSAAVALSASAAIETSLESSSTLQSTTSTRTHCSLQ